MPDEPFRYRRRVAFGDCDPARIYYTPRAIDYCVEAIESWWETVLGVSWIELLERRGLEARFLRVDCEFVRPLVAGQTVRVAVGVRGIGRSRIAFALAGEGDSGETFFRAGLEACLVDPGGASPVPVPREFRERVKEYRSSRKRESAGTEAARRGSALPQHPLTRMRSVPDGLFARTRRVVYGDCGVAGTVYAPKIFDFAVEVVGEWFEEVLGVSWLELVSVRGQGAPAVAVSCEYLRPMVPGEAITMIVGVNRLGGASVGFVVGGYDAAGEACFDARMTLCFIDQEAGFRSMPIPKEFADRIRAYRAVCEAGWKGTRATREPDAGVREQTTIMED